MKKNITKNKLPVPSVAILYYKGSKHDDEDTWENVKSIAGSLKRSRITVRKIAVTRKNWKKAIRTEGDVVFNLVEDDTWELYVKIGHALEKLKRAQVGHDMNSFRYSTRKTWLKRNTL